MPCLRHGTVLNEIIRVLIYFSKLLYRYGKGRKGSGSGLSGFKLLAVTMKQLANPYQMLILPITMFIGAEQAFLAADYTAVSCQLC